MIKLISGGGSSYSDAVKNTQNKIGVKICKDKCLFIIMQDPKTKHIVVASSN